MTILIPEAATCLANSLPIPDEAPVTSAQGPNLFLSSAAFIFLLRFACLGLVVFVVRSIALQSFVVCMSQLTDLSTDCNRPISFANEDSCDVAGRFFEQALGKLN